MKEILFIIKTRLAKNPVFKWHLSSALFTTIQNPEKQVFGSPLSLICYRESEGGEQESDSRALHHIEGPQSLLLLCRVGRPMRRPRHVH